MISSAFPTTESSRGAPAPHPASFRDPGGFVYRDSHGTLLRQVHPSAVPAYEQMMRSGLYRELVHLGLLIEHEEVPLESAADSRAARVLRPRELPFISYPYEWSFHMLRDAALLTLEVQRRALRHGLSLQDASAFNVQFEGCRPRLIDTLSFALAEPGRPWQAYGQFCRHFLAPLALVRHVHPALGRITCEQLDGVPLDLASRLLPWRTRLRPGLLMHLHAHAWFIGRHADTHQAEGNGGDRRPTSRFNSASLELLIESLQRAVHSLRWNPGRSEWSGYYSDHSYSSEEFLRKKRLVGDMLGPRPGVVWDLGANTGVFSRLAAESAERVAAFDVDPACVDRHYSACRAEKVEHVLPLVMDFSNPSPAIGWNHCERASLVERGPGDTALALALVHHLAIANNVPLPCVADWLARLCRRLIIEFVPKSDPQVRRLLVGRVDHFHAYHQQEFERAFESRFRMQRRESVNADGRLLYLYENRDKSL